MDYSLLLLKANDRQADWVNKKVEKNRIRQAFVISMFVMSQLMMFITIYFPLSEEVEIH